MYKSHVIPITNEVSPNVTYDLKDYHLSYCASSRDYGCATTAIVLKGTFFLVLNGNHKDVLAELATSKGFQGVFDYFIEHIEQANKFSEHKPAAEKFVWKAPDKKTVLADYYKTAVELLGQANYDRMVEAYKATL